MLCESVTDMIGSTPLLRLKNIEERYALGGHIFAKIESMNPAGSTKDRAALGMIHDAELTSGLKPGSLIIEPTSGNTGIAMAAIAASRGYRCIITMPDSMSKERIKLMRVYGAEVVLTPGALGMKGAIIEAKKIRDNNPGSIILGQFDNQANPREHFRTTGPEIYRDLGGKIDCFVAGIGSGGTFSGVSRFLKDCIPNVHLVAVEPASSPVITKGVKHAAAHKLQGIGANFVPKNFDKSLADEILTVTDGDANEFFKVIPKTEGIFVGISSAAALCAAVNLAARPEFSNKNIVTIFPDTGDRYLSEIK